jgi:V/A-type H+-transporting ATPase subunit K
MVLIEVTKELSAALVMSLSALAAGYAIAKTGSAASAAVAEKPDVSGKVLLFVALAEAIAIYGLVVALVILVK